MNHEPTIETIPAKVNQVAQYCHKQAADAGWWTFADFDEQSDPTDIVRRKIVKMALVQTEISEAVEGIRKDTMDNHLPHRKSEEVELADAVIRIFDYAAAYNLDLGGAIKEKLEYNQRRPDHKPQHRAADGGKKV